MKALWLLGLVWACSFGDPTAGATFKCDATHGCPSGQACVNGLCGGAAGMPGVACGSAGTCAPGAACCVDFINPPRCVGSVEACTSGQAATCDGPADCTAPAQCCGAAAPQCGSAGCSPRACAVPADCDAAEPQCCIATPMLPWGVCSPTPC